MISRIVVVALALAACKTSPPAKDTGSPAPHDSRKLVATPADATGAAAIDAATIDGATPPSPSPDARPKGTSMTPEEILQDHYASDSRGAPVNLRAFPNVPGFFHAEWAKDAEYVLVHDGALVTTKGLDALAAFAKSVDLLSAAKLEANDLIKLVQFFDAWAGPYLRDGFNIYDTLKDQLPKLERDHGAATLTLSYVQPPSQGARRNANVRKVTRAVLTITKAYQMSWSTEIIEVELPQP